MKKLFFGFILIQFFILIGGQNQAFAHSGQANHLPNSGASTSSNPDNSQFFSGDICQVKALPAHSEKGNHLFEFFFFETEEEDDRLNGFAHSLESILFLSLHHLQFRETEASGTDNPGESSSISPFSHSPSPPYLIFQVFRI